MDEQLRPVSSHEPEPIIVEIEGVGELEFPADTDPSVIEAKVKELTTQRPEQIGAAHEPDYMGADGGLGKRVMQNAPVVGAMAATMLGPGGILPSVGMAALGGAAGAMARGDALPEAVVEGGTQGLLQGAGGLAAKTLGAAGRSLYRLGIPKNVQDKFAQADLAQQGINSGVLLGTRRGVSTAKAANAQAGREAESASRLAPSLTPKDIEKAFRPKYSKAVLAGKPDRAQQIREHVSKTQTEMGNAPLSGRRQYARKEFLEQEGKSAMTAPNANMAAVDPQLANIERRAIVQNLRRNPEMAKALDTSQAAVGMERAARATQNSTVGNRLAHGGLWNAARSPLVLSASGMATHGARNVVDPNMLRLAILAMLQEHEQ